jgi:uncharacterized damage-inducible protein DinB
MSIATLLLPELDSEAKIARATLARVPADKVDFRPAVKSMTLGRLAAHVAQLGGFGTKILTAPGLDFATAGMKPLQFESAEQVVKALDEGIGASRAALAAVADSAWQDRWKLSNGAHVILESSRFEAYRAMFLNHIVHHRAQLGVYLRLLDVPVPSTYGPSADES